MVINEGTDNGDCTECASHVNCAKSEVVTRVFHTYKRRRQIKSTYGSNGKEDGKTHVEAAVSQIVDETIEEPSHTLRGSNSCDHVQWPNNNLNKCPEDLWRSVLLQHICQSSSVNEGSVPMCVQDAFAFHSGINCPSRVRIFDTQDGNKNDYLARTGSMSSTVHMASHRGIGVVSNGSLEKTNRCGINEKCRQAFLNIIDSPNFISLCKHLSENFRGIKADNIFDFSLVNSRMREGAYENSPILFLSDIQQIWKKFQAVGNELVSLATSLSGFSRSIYHEQVEVSGCNAFEDGKRELTIWDSHCRALKAEPTGGFGAYKVCTCRSCGEKAEGIDCLVCDSCEEIYHVSCIKPPVKEIPPKSWYCTSCTANGFGLRHDNCVVCERLNSPKTLTKGVDEVLLTNEDDHHMDENPKCGLDDGIQQPKVSKYLGSCRVCGNGVEYDDKYRSCSHLFCDSHFYHTRCLTKKQLRFYDTTRWYCPSCLCRFCLIDRDDDKIILCDSCDHGYHLYCLKPRRTSIPVGQWFCNKCEARIRTIRRAKRAYENFENEQNERGKDAIGGHGNQVKKQNVRGEEELDKGRGGMDMLLTAAFDISS